MLVGMMKVRAINIEKDIDDNYDDVDYNDYNDDINWHGTDQSHEQLFLCPSIPDPSWLFA